MTGMSANDSRAGIAKETGLAEDVLAQLGVGQFSVKVGNRPAFRLDVPAFLIGNRQALSWEDWHGVRSGRDCVLPEIGASACESHIMNRASEPTYHQKGHFDINRLDRRCCRRSAQRATMHGLRAAVGRYRHHAAALAALPSAEVQKSRTCA
jgi:hypothetical protein